MSGEELRAALIRAVAETHGVANPNVEPGSWWEHKAQPVLALAAPSTPEPSGLEGRWVEGVGVDAFDWLAQLKRTVRAAWRSYTEHKDYSLDLAEAVTALNAMDRLDALRAAPSTTEPSDLVRDAYSAGYVDAAENARRAAPSTEPAPDTCGVLARCGRPKDHRGHHGGWRT